MTNPLESKTSSSQAAEPDQPSGWLKVGAIAAASAVLGVMFAAWWYRNTLIRLRQAKESGPNPEIGISEGDPPDGV